MEGTPRFRRDLAWNLLSIVVLGVSGLLLNLVIGRVYGPDVLGVFSQALACYLILSQLSAGGLHPSILYYAGLAQGRTENDDARLSAALALGALQATLVCCLTWVLAGPVADFFASPGMAVALRCIVPGLWFLTMNKILLGCLNGYRYMRLFAMFQALRYIFMLTALLMLVQQRASGDVLALCLSAAEIVLFPLLLFWAWKERHLSRVGMRGWLGQHARFSGKAFLSGLLMDTNTRVDVIMLGYFCSDAEVGIYGCAAMFAEGFFHILIAVQNNVTPLLSQLRAEGRQQELASMMRRGFWSLLGPLTALLLISTVVFSPLVQALTASPLLASGWPIYALLGIGYVLGSSYLPYIYVLNQWGFPGRFVALLSMITLTNVILNALFIPAWSSMGSALATSISWVSGGAYLRLLLRGTTS
jgi:O-antigen/teichoic acid export membrane protein